MRIAFPVVALAVTACSAPIQQREVPDSEFRTLGDQELECFGSIADAARPLINQLSPDLRGERGAFEVRVTRRDEEIYVIDAQQWDSGHDERGYYHDRQILERRDSDWCQTRILHRTVRVDSY